MLVCPRDHAPLERRDDTMICASGHEYQVVHDVPVLVDPELEPTQPGYWSRPMEVDRVRATALPPLRRDEVDPYVAQLLVGTHGNLYKAVETVERYPIPSFPMRPAGGRRLLDVGCNWGRWSLAAAAAGFDVIGVDPSIEAVAIAARIARQHGVPNRYVAGDARRLPFADASFDYVFSYSVLQHFSRDSVIAAVDEVGRVLGTGGVALIQMANSRGARSLYHQARRGFKEPGLFNIRYWSPAALRRVFSRIGDVSLAPDGFFTLNPQVDDLDLLRPQARMVVRASTVLRRLSGVIHPVVGFADSLWVRVEKR